MGDCVKVTHINDLPPELLVHIFSFYAKSEGNAKLYTILAKVSTAWRRAALARSLWAEVSFTADDFNDGHSCLNDKDFRARISWIKALHFKYSPFFDKSMNFSKLMKSTLKPVLESCWNLQNFSLEYDCNVDITLNTLPFVFDLPTLCPQITEIEIHGMYWVNNDMQDRTNRNVIFTWVEKYNTNLTSLIMSSIHFCYPSYNLTSLSQKIAEFCPNMAIFKYHGGGTLWNKPGTLDLNSLQAGCPKMKELCLENVSFLDDDDDLTSCFPHLETFCFMPSYDKGCRYDGQQDIVRVLRGSKELKELELIGPIFKCETMLQLPFKSLKKLRFQYSSVTNDLYDVLCRWKHTLIEIDALCNEESQQCVFRYIKQYGKDNLECLTLMGGPRQQGSQIKSILRPCAKLRYFHTQIEPTEAELTDNDYVYPFNYLCLKTRKQFCQWLDL